ncbi:hypothetical protein PENANT_c020G10424 [Penicillium antarcticum]|uniref:Uncharacterized protein n=1 Tax=Penicillium antarcticum TaxID=416450 RepID=A0A1V6Q1G2_9EURO|nr:uncharacterized protein N7508_004320 [Penicillium antarcticum]KAJ5308941.1 hypothetical protein N7508_004320 [Penicillium antarcticum]OQD82702.1 hypothetical protein PENANT_c020G10424 [Penicillium antarcticum]
MSNKPALESRNNSSRTPLIVLGVIGGTLIFLAMSGTLLYLFSRKERARRRNALAQEVEAFSPLQPPPAYKVDDLRAPRGPHSAQPRPLSSFAPDFSRHDQFPRASYEQPPPYPTYDPSRYQPNHPLSNELNAHPHPHAYTYPNQPIPVPAGQGQGPGPSSRLSAVHYHDARQSLSLSRPLSVVGQVPPGPGVGPVPAAVPRPRRQTGMPPPPERPRQEGRERSVSEPTLLQPAGPRRPKPVLSRLITNFR